jgi:uncharacterized membrane protein
LVDPKVLQIINSLRINISKKRTIFEKISLLVFIWFFLLFILNLQYTLTNSYDENIFLFTIIILFCVVIYQIFFSKINAVIMIFEIFLIYLSLLLLYNVGYSGLRDSDAYLDYNFLKIIWGGHFTLGNDPAGVKGWPILHIFSAINSQLTNISPLLIAKYLPSFISSIIILPIYLLIYEVHNNKKVALFSCLIFGSVPQFITFVSDFVRETIGLFFMILFLYILYLSKKRDNYRLIFLALLLIPIIIFSHHLTSFLTIVLLGMYILVSIVIPYLYRIDKQIQLSGKINILIIFLILSLGVITYWVWSANIIVQVFEKTFTTKAEVTTSYAARINLGASILTLKGYITVFISFIFFSHYCC